MSKHRARFFAFVIFALLPATPVALAQATQLRVDYTVAVADVERQLFHVTTSITGIREPHLTLSLPIWTPGWYTVENYAKNILRFKVTDASGKRLQPVMTRKQTWRVETAGVRELTVEFDYHATTLALNQAKITKDFAFFTGTQLFLEVSGHRKKPSDVRFEFPEGWRIMTSLKDTRGPKVFTASDYDTLVDSTTQMGIFDVTRFDVEGKPHYFVATPAGAFSQEKSARFVEMLTKAYTAQLAIFGGGLPYDKHICFYFFQRAESNAAGALEHGNSFVAFAPPGDRATPEMLIGTAAHEFFHTWNVKRIRPAEMFPYDYARENETSLLWFSEGFTNYYTEKSLLRAGIRTRENFLSGVGRAMGGVESNEARHYISPADASTSTWLGYDTPQPFEISYYTQGQNLGALLDLAMLADTKGAAGLDEVFRILYREYYQKGKGFTADELLAIINRVARSDYRDFFKKYVFGVEVPDYNRFLGLAGYQLDAQALAQKRYQVVAVANPTAEQLKIREAWMAAGAAKAASGR